MTTQQITIAIMAVSVIAAIVMIATDINTLLIIAVWCMPFFALARLGTTNTSTKD